MSKPRIIDDHNYNMVIDEVCTAGGDTPGLTTNILRHWSREKIERFAKHLLGDAAQEPTFTIDEIEAWHTYLRNIGEIAWVERNLRSPRFGLAAHARKEDEG